MVCAGLGAKQRCLSTPVSNEVSNRNSNSFIGWPGVFLRDCLGHHERRSQHCGAQCPRCLPEPPLAEALAGHALSVRTAWRAGPPEGIRPDHEHCADGESRAGVFDVSRLLLRRIRPCCSAYMIWLRTQRCYPAAVAWPRCQLPASTRGASTTRACRACSTAELEWAI